MKACRTTGKSAFYPMRVGNTSADSRREGWPSGMKKEILRRKRDSLFKRKVEPFNRTGPPYGTSHMVVSKEGRGLPGG